MGLLKYVALWFNILRAPEETIDKISRTRYDMADGILSVGIIGVVAGLLCFLGSLFFQAEIYKYMPTANLFVICVIGIPMAVVLCLIVGTAFFRVASKLLKGKGNYERECGIFGILVGSITLAYLPFLIINGIGTFAAVQLAVPALAQISMGLGLLLTLPLAGIVGGSLYQLIANEEKASIPRAGMMLSLGIGIFFFLLMLLASTFMPSTIRMPFTG